MNSYCFGCTDKGGEICPRTSRIDNAGEVTVMLGAASLGTLKALLEGMSFVVAGTFGSVDSFNQVKEVRTTRRIRKLAIDFCAESHQFSDGYFNRIPAPTDIVDTAPLE